MGAPTGELLDGTSHCTASRSSIPASSDAPFTVESVADVVEVVEGDLHRLRVGGLQVGDPVLLKELLDPLRDDRVAELGHGREEVVLDLEVEVRHPPVHPLERTGFDVHGVPGRVYHPGNVLVRLHDGEVRVRDGEVDEDVGGPDSVGEERAEEGRPEPEHGRHVAEDEGPSQPHEEELVVVLRAEGVAGVEVELPEHSHHRADHVWEQHGLHSKPRLASRGLLVRCGVEVEEDERERVQIYIVLELLWHGVVLVVLVSPPRGGHSAAEAVGYNLQRVINCDVPGQGVVASLVHQPTASSFYDSENGEAGEVPSVEDEVQAEHMHEDDLCKPEEHVRVVRLEETFLLEIGSQLYEISYQLVVVYDGVTLLCGAGLQSLQEPISAL
eukprot:CAMPEP_0185276546 /NCGR_PEP_ID=MMETSP1359-20130426/56412_1 /TAXON_ID=552665 /ORGANISM="Bigelowiella longifila, Strain CCMP242" /LENGTH=384 /DNA_ID=CAMNT_0027870255 /DNA_START=157 /DNA_END=1312 /DNA_ORIENTATION=-